MCSSSSSLRPSTQARKVYAPWRLRRPRLCDAHLTLQWGNTASLRSVSELQGYESRRGFRGYQAHLKANNAGEVAGDDAATGDDQQARGKGQERKKLALEFKGMLERYGEAHVKSLVLEEKVKSLEGDKEHWREMVIRLADRLLSGFEESLPVVVIEGNGEAGEEEDCVGGCMICCGLDSNPVVFIVPRMDYWESAV